MNCNKIRYDDRRTALSAINLYASRGHGSRSRRNHRKAPSVLRACFCDLCEAWHVTSKADCR